MHSFLGRMPPDDMDVLAAMERHLAVGAVQPVDGWYGISVTQALAAKRKAEWSGKSCVLKLSRSGSVAGSWTDFLA